jgi:hypothetical protein
MVWLLPPNTRSGRQSEVATSLWFASLKRDLTAKAVSRLPPHCFAAKVVFLRPRSGLNENSPALKRWVGVELIESPWSGRLKNI